MGVLSVVGLDDAQQAVYGALADLASGTAKELGDATGLGARVVARALEELRTRGLAEALVGDEQRWAMTPPEPALDALVHETQRELAQVRAHALALADRAREREERGRPAGLVSIAEGGAAVEAHYEQLQRGAREQVLVFDRPPYPSSGGTVPNAFVAEGSARGVEYRSVFDSVLLSDLAWTGRVQADIDHGVSGRVMEGLPLKLAIGDRTMAMVPLHDADPERGLTALVVRPSVLLDSLVALFEALWQRAVPLRLDAGQVPDVDPGLVEVVRLLASGMTDVAIARQWRASERTVRRRVADAMEVLGAGSRMQLGMLAERRGWLRDSRD